MPKYIARTQTEILQDLLNNMPDEYLKYIGTFTYDLNKAVSLQLADYETKIEELWNYFDVTTLSGMALEERVSQLKGLDRKKATHAVGEITVLGTGLVTIGDLFETENAVQFIASETVKIVNTGKVKIKAVKPGKVGNVGASSIKLIPVTIQGIKAVTNEKATFDGFDEESDEDLIERYLIAVRTPATSGNKYHYLQWAREVEGVGDAKVFPLWNGKNTVKVVIIDSNKQPASSELIKKVQNYIDPQGEHNATWGAGYGQAPIGAYCTVTSAKAKEININLTVIKEAQIELSNLKIAIEKNIIEFLKNVAFKKDYISYSLLGNAILSTEGVVEWATLTINGGTSSIQIGEEEIATFKGLVLNEQRR